MRSVCDGYTEGKAHKANRRAVPAVQKKAKTVDSQSFTRSDGVSILLQDFRVKTLSDKKEVLVVVANNGISDGDDSKEVWNRRGRETISP